ncbi:MAG: hypothetical protein IKF01_04585 [Bacilli bacterium]|nr:hypothetical protein [Bacilli bacterium]
MSKKDYQISKNVDLIYKRGYSNFLSILFASTVKSLVKGSKIYNPFEDCERQIVYLKDKPKLTIFEIVSYEEITHREIMGSIYNLSIDTELFGDIIKNDKKFYIIILKHMEDVIKGEFTKVGDKSIKLRKVDISILNSYKREYEPYKLIVSSLRLDTIVSKIVGTSRDKVKKLFKDESVIVNYSPIYKNDKSLTVGDIFSIRGHGKYKFEKIYKKTKKGGYIIELKKYV